LHVKSSGWTHKIAAFAGGLGAPGLFLISFLDSSFIPFPVINDGLLISFSIQNHARMPLYALLASLGSVSGCVLLYFIARKGGEAYFRRKAGGRAEVIRKWVEKNGFGGMLIAALLPPPTPFKFFVLAAGVFEIPLFSFASAIALARLIRYFGVGFLAVKYGDNAKPFISQHWLAISIGFAIFAMAGYGLSRWLLPTDTAAK
jgi:membrane protein YqaA with SNARE-associated domain